MSIKRSKTSALFFATVYTGSLCLCQVACQVGGNTDEDTQKPSIAPDKFKVELNDVTRTQNFLLVSITPGSSGMMLKDFFVTAAIDDDKGEVSGHTGVKKSGAFVYDVALKDCCLGALWLQSPANCLGQDDTRFAQGKKVLFRAKAIPNTTTGKGDPYTLNVKIERRGSNLHTETKSIVLTAQQDGKVRKVHTKGDNTPWAGPQTPVPDSSVPLNSAASGTANSTTADSPDDANTSSQQDEEDPRGIIGETGNSDATLNTNPGQETTPSDSATTEPSNDTATNNQQDVKNAQEPPSTSEGLTITLQDVTQNHHTKNFVTVTIQPSGNGMALNEFSVTASLAGQRGGTVKGSGKKQGSSFVYNLALNNCSLETLFLTNVKCLGTEDTSFAQGNSVSFRIESRPCKKTTPGEQYTLTVKVEHKGSNPHTETKSIPLKSTQKSPLKKKKHATPRES